MSIQSIRVEQGSEVEADRATATSVGKAFAILDTFLATKDTVLGLSEIARRADVAKSTAFRLLTLLEARGLVERASDGPGWLLGPYLFRLGNTVPMCRPNHLRDQALPMMQDLHRSSEGMVNLAIPHENQVLYIARLSPRRRLQAPANVGGYLPMHGTALGKAMLASSSPWLFDRVVEAGLKATTSRTITDRAALAQDLARVRRNGYAVDNQELRPGLVCIAAPIIKNGRVFGAMSLSLPARHGIPTALTARVRQAASNLSRALAYENDVLGLEAAGS